MVIPYSYFDKAKRSLGEGAKNSAEKPLSKRRRRRPLLALGDRRVGTDLNKSDCSQQLLKLPEMNLREKERLFARLREEFLDFLRSAHNGWSPEEECRRFTVLGECITCTRWRGLYLISSADIVKAMEVLYRLYHMGTFPGNRRRFEEGILCYLRNLQVGNEALLEASNSDLLKYLYKINCVKTHKRQKVFIWSAVPFYNIYIDAVLKQKQCFGNEGGRDPGVFTMGYHQSEHLQAYEPPRCDSCSSALSRLGLGECSEDSRGSAMYSEPGDFSNLHRFAEAAVGLSV